MTSHSAEKAQKHEHWGEGACESCDCCAAGWCLNFEDGSPWDDFLDRKRHYTPEPSPGSPVWQAAVDEFDQWCEIAVESRGFDLRLPAGRDTDDG